MDRVDIIGVSISATNMDECIRVVGEDIDIIRGNYICAANVHTTVMASEDSEYKEIQNKSFMTLPDGKPLSIVGRKKGFKDMDRVTGPEFMEKILELSEDKGWSHYFYGNTSKNLNMLIDTVKNRYPNLKIKGYESSVFRPLTDAEKITLIDKINSVNPDFVWVGLGAPLQEEFCAELCNKTNSIWVGVGGAFNVIAGVIPRAPEWMQKCCLEWFYRFLKEPKRLFKRYFITNTKFIYRVINEKNYEE